MHLYNVRLGHAANSSSTHSLILLPPGHASSGVYGNDFGWDHFTAADPESKENYLGLLLKYRLYEELGKDIAAQILDQLYPHRPDFSKAIEEGYVDHQSMWTLPRRWDGHPSPDPEFFEALRAHIVDRPVAILGGNDNENDSHPLANSGESVVINLPKDESAHVQLVCRRDGDSWTLFNRDSGAKIRFGFGDVPEPERSAVPELVDVKITNHCTFGCQYCYQSSVPSVASHVPLDRLQMLAEWFGDLRVFEVALGGGEPTLHPQFKAVLQAFRSRGVVPNFTTRSLHWLADPEILDLAGCFAFSVDGPEDIARLVRAIDKRDIYRGTWAERGSGRPQVTVQYVVGSGGDLAGVLSSATVAGLRVTLLGYKAVGFGVEYQERTEDWVAAVERARIGYETGMKVEGHSQARFYPNLAVDTKIVALSETALWTRMGVNPLLINAYEGKHSMYVDAVLNRVGPSSYCDDNFYESLTTKEALLASFNRW